MCAACAICWPQCLRSVTNGCTFSDVRMRSMPRSGKASERRLEAALALSVEEDLELVRAHIQTAVEQRTRIEMLWPDALFGESTC